MCQNGGKKRRSRKKGRGQNGEGFVDNAKSVLSTIGNSLAKANKFARDTKIISTAGKLLTPIPVIGQAAGTIGNIAGSLGYGKRRQRGSGGIRV